MGEIFVIKCLNVEEHGKNVNAATSHGYYIHFNPHSSSYYIEKGLRGAATFRRAAGERLINKIGNVPGQFVLEQLKASSIVEADRSSEKALYDQTH